jgi:hypothetical protein
MVVGLQQVTCSVDVTIKPSYVKRRPDYHTAGAGNLNTLLRRRAIAINPIKPEPKSQAAGGIGTTAAPLAKPVMELAPGLLLAHAEPLEMQGKK